MRNARIALLCAALLVALPAPSLAGDIIIPNFTPGGPLPAEVLRDVTVKGLIAEFLDPGDTGLGKNTCYLLWREVLTAISDQGGAGVILARSPSDTRLTDLLAKDYHRSAVDIAKGQNARMAFWGVATEADGRVYLEGHLTLLPEVIGSDLSLAINVGGRKIAPLWAEVVRGRYNFAPVETTRESLFERALVPRRDVKVRREPLSGSATIATVKASDVLRSVGMQGAWFRVRLPEGREGWVENSQVEVPPIEAVLPAGQYRLTSDAAGQKNVRKIDLAGTYPVLDMRYTTKRGLAYKIEDKGTTAWIDAINTRPRYSLPAVHFIAALYRYQAGNLDETKRELDAFIAEAESSESSAVLSSAYQLRAATILAQPSGDRVDPAKLAAINQDLDTAASLTPYDPAIYRLRALAAIGAGRSLAKALPELQKALELDRLDPGSLRILAALSSLVDPRTADSQWRGVQYALDIRPADAEALAAMRKRFPEPAN